MNNLAELFHNSLMGVIGLFLDNHGYNSYNLYILFMIYDIICTIYHGGIQPNGFRDTNLWIL